MNGVNRFLLYASLLCPLSAAQAQTAPARLRIDVLEGEGAINNISEHRAREPVVRVLDDKGAPVKGASVTFLLPGTGPSGEFGGGVRVLTAFTDEKGEAVGRGLAPNQSAGPFQIRAVASFQGLTASAVINQTNALARASAGRTSKKFWLIAVAGGAAAAGAALAARGHGGSTPATSPASGPTPPQPGIVISAGTPSFQPPH